ncbi:MAG: hypothetical protein AB1626_02890 [Candidatus Micrarchaeota archaeon]
MKKAFVFTITSLLLFTIVFTLALLVAQDDWRRPLRANMVWKRISYVWDDVNEGIGEVLHLKIIKNEENITVIDVLPPPLDAETALEEYDDFVYEVYKVPGLDINFSVASLATMGSNLLIYAYNYSTPITYEYGDWGKRVLRIVCGECEDGEEDCDEECEHGEGHCDEETANCDAIQAVEFSHKVSVPFRYDPGDPDNQNKYTWNPAPPSCTPGSLHCLVFKLTVTDSLGRVYRCPWDGPGVTCPYFTYDWTSNQAGDLKIDLIEPQSCWYDLVLSKDAGDQVVVTVRLWDSHGDTCGQLWSNTTFTMNSTLSEIYYDTNLSVGDPSFESVKDEQARPPSS